MPKGRGGILLILFFLLLILLVVWLLRQQGSLNLFGAQQGQIPIELKNIVPKGWTLREQQPAPCSFDDDPDNEWLLLYNYDPTSVPNVYANNAATFNVIGGVVYDAQVNRAPQELGDASPYRPALLVPYKLLPDYYTDKGQGYLGESDVRFYPYTPAPQGTKEAPGCHAEELYFLGYSYASLPTRLSIFHWAGREVGYKGVHFVGNAHVDAPDTVDPTKSITEVFTYNRLANHRSVLCEVRHFKRKGALADLRFPEEPTDFTIDFCFGTPKDPAYPEAALIALLRGADPPADGSPTGSTFLTKNAEVDGRLKALIDQNRAVRILSIANQGTIAPNPAAGGPCPPEAIVLPTPPPTDDRADNWWCAGEEAYAEAEIMLPDSDTIYRTVARLISIANEQVTADVHWRVVSLQLYAP